MDKSVWKEAFANAISKSKRAIRQSVLGYKTWRFTQFFINDAKQANPPALAPADRPMQLSHLATPAIANREYSAVKIHSDTIDTTIKLS
jgi:hypothetical protein